MVQLCQNRQSYHQKHETDLNDAKPNYYSAFESAFNQLKLAPVRRWGLSRGGKADDEAHANRINPIPVRSVLNFSQRNSLHCTRMCISH